MASIRFFQRLLQVWLAVLAMVASSWLFAQAPESPVPPPAERRPANTISADGWLAGTQTVWLRQPSGARFYLLHVPPGMPPGRFWPVVFAFHGGGGHAGHMADEAHYALLSMAAREGWALVLPNGHSRWPGGRLATWNAGGCCGEARDQSVDDVAFVRAVLADVKTRLPVDERRVFAMGMSNGGMFAYRLACEAADLFAAVASVAGTDATLECTPRRPVSVLHIHARDDDHVQYHGGAGPAAFRDRSKVMAFISVPETGRRWRQRNRCEGTPQLWQGPGTRAASQCEIQTQCAGGSRVMLCTTGDGGHSWPGAPQPAGGDGLSLRRKASQPSQALDANRVIAAFFTGM